MPPRPDTSTASDPAVGRTRRVLPRVQPPSGAQCAVDGGEDRRPHLEHLGRRPGRGADHQYARSGTTGTVATHGFRTRSGDRDGAREHEDWCRYYRAAGWRFGTPRDNSRKIHDKLVDWETIESDPVQFKTALSSLATTLTRLRELGYRSRRCQRLCVIRFGNRHSSVPSAARAVVVDDPVWRDPTRTRG